MRLVKFGPDGFAIAEMPVDPELTIVPGNLTPVDGQRLALVDGTPGLVWDLRGSSAYGGPDGRTDIRVPNTPAMMGKSWDDLAAETSAEHPHGILRAPRPETSAEKKAREKVAADAAAAAVAERKARRSLSPVQIRFAASQLGLRDAIEALVADPATPRAFRDYWEYSTEYRRSHPIWPDALALIGKTETDLDALYDLGETL